MQDRCWYERTIVLVVGCYIICVMQLNRVLLVMMKTVDPRRILHLMMAELYPLIKGMRSCVLFLFFFLSVVSKSLYFLMCLFSFQKFTFVIYFDVITM